MATTKKDHKYKRDKIVRENMSKAHKKQIPWNKGTTKGFSFNSTVWNKKNPLKVKEMQLRRNYGITLNEYNLLLNVQNNLCAICGKSPTTRNLDVDHDHLTGKIRGLLCSNCNTGLGMLKENLNIIESMKNYIIKHKTTLESC